MTLTHGLFLVGRPPSFSGEASLQPLSMSGSFGEVRGRAEVKVSLVPLSTIGGYLTVCVLW